MTHLMKVNLWNKILKCALALNLFLGGTTGQAAEEIALVTARFFPEKKAIVFRNLGKQPFLLIVPDGVETFSRYATKQGLSFRVHRLPKNEARRLLLLLPEGEGGQRVPQDPGILRLVDDEVVIEAFKELESVKIEFNGYNLDLHDSGQKLSSLISGSCVFKKMK